MSKSYEQQLAEQLYGQERFSEAEAAFRLAIAKSPNDAGLLLGLAMCIPQDERPDEALSVFRRVVELDHRNADAWNGIGCCEVEPIESEIAFRRALASEPDCVDFHVNLAICLHRQERTEEAEIAFRRASELEPQNLSLLCDWVNLLLELRRFRDAEFKLRKALEARGGREALLAKRAWWYYEEGRYAQAEEIFAHSRGGPDDPAEALAHMLLGRICMERRDLDEAVISFKTAIALSPTAAEYHAALGDVLEATGRREEAFAARTRAEALKR